MKYVGKDIGRKDGYDKATGRGLFTSDIFLPRMTYAKVLRSPYAHAKVLSIDTSEAEALPGVVAVASFKNTTNKLFNCAAPMFLTPPPHQCVLDQTVFTDTPKYIGDEIAAVAAETVEIAEKAVKLIKVEYQELPAVYDPLEAMKPDAPKVQPECANPQFNNICGGPIELAFGGDVDEAFKKCDVIAEYELVLPRVKQAQMETHGAVATYNPDGHLEVICTTQAPYPTKYILAEAFDLPYSHVTVKNPPYVGGGFGVRIGISGKAEAIAAALSMKCFRPVKYIYTREEDFTCSDSRHGGYLKMKLGATKDGKIIAQDGFAALNTGAYATFGVDLLGVCGACGTLGTYNIPNARYLGWPVYTNQETAGAMRGYGSPQGCSMVEPCIEILAEKLGMDSIELRKMNTTKEGDQNWFPYWPEGVYTTNECLDIAAEKSDYYKKHGKAKEQTGRYRRGIGIATCTHVTNAGPFCVEHNTVTARIEADGTLLVNGTFPEIGPGTSTAALQVACELIGTTFDDARLAFGNTDLTGFDVGSHATRTIYTVSKCLEALAPKLRAQIFQYVADTRKLPLDKLDMAESIITCDGKEVVTLKEIALEAHLGGRMFIETTNTTPPGLLPKYAQTAEVEVDVETGMVRCLKVVAPHDVGRAVNPPLCRGQIEGGVLQAVGYALTEEMTYQEGKGFYNKNFHSYMEPTADSRPEIEAILVEHPENNGTLGIIGIGEIGIIPTLAAINNAVYDATGVRFHEFPLTPERVLNGLKAAGITAK